MTTFRKEFIPFSTNRIEKKILNLNLYNKYYIRSSFIQNNKKILFLDNDNKIHICADFRKQIKPIWNIKETGFTVDYPLFKFKGFDHSFKIVSNVNKKIEEKNLCSIFNNLKRILSKKYIRALLISSTKGGYFIYCGGVRGYVPTSKYNLLLKKSEKNFQYSANRNYFLKWYKISLVYIKIGIKLINWKEKIVRKRKFKLKKKKFKKKKEEITKKKIDKNKKKLIQTKKNLIKKNLKFTKITDNLEENTHYKFDYKKMKSIILVKNKTKLRELKKNIKLYKKQLKIIKKRRKSFKKKNLSEIKKKVIDSKLKECKELIKKNIKKNTVELKNIKKNTVKNKKKKRLKKRLKKLSSGRKFHLIFNIKTTKYLSFVYHKMLKNLKKKVCF